MGIRAKTGETYNKFIEAKDNDWPFPDIYFTSKRCSVRGFSFAFPNASAKLKEHLLPSKNLLNVTSGTEEVDNVLTQNDIFLFKKIFKIKLTGTIRHLKKTLSTKATFYTIQATLFWILS